MHRIRVLVALAGVLVMAVPVPATEAIPAVAGPGPARRVEIGPESDLCVALRALKPGDELVLQPGDYQGPCAMRRGGARGAPVVVRAADLRRRPRVVYRGSSTNVLEIRASHVIIHGLEFGPTLPDVDAIRVFRADDITIEECRFSELGGIAVVANHSDVHGLVVRRNEIRSTRSTGMYFGCHDGQGCVVSGLLVEGNYIQRVTAPDHQIGYGVQLKLNTTGVVRDNVIMDTKGPGIMVYGALETARASVIERNLVAGSHNSSGIVVGGGPALVRNNIAVRNAEAGIGLEDYGKRGLLLGVVVAHNTIYENGLGGIAVPEHGLLAATVARNAVTARAHTAALPAPRAGLVLSGNVDCSARTCFVAPDEWDFSARAGSPLSGVSGVAGPAADGVMPPDDFFGMARSTSPTIGAVEYDVGPIRIDIRP